MLRSFHHGPSVDEAHEEADHVDRSPEPAYSSWPIAATLWTMCVSLRDALAAHRQYEHLRWRAFSHDTAIRGALGISHPSKPAHAKDRGAVPSDRRSQTQRSSKAIAVCGQGMKHHASRHVFAKIGHQTEVTMGHQEQDIGNAKLNPAREFKTPMHVVAANEMAAAEKLAILRAWEADERALQRAESEGMGGGEHAHLQKVQEALERLREGLT